ncbi:MAG: hypothetical protein M1812_001646 [Candelaria pacifica]|nr:MAG: hypothetical protein M1812_001646 [Candelaria pacifica]
MDSYQTYREPSDQRSPVLPIKVEPRWGGPREDFGPPTLDRTDSYRRRSPGPQDRRPRGGRGRSRSPQAIDRYQPSDGRPPRDEFYGGPRGREDRRRSSPPPMQGNIDRYIPGQDTGKNTILVNPIQDPMTMEFQVGFNYFAEWWRINESIKEERERQKNGGRRPNDRLKGDRESREEREKEKGKIQLAYDTYKEELQMKMAKSFVQQHKAEEWFKERYVPEIRDTFRERLNEYRRGNYSRWEQDIDAGTFDEFTLEGIYKSESNGAGGVVEKEEGETVAAAEVLGVGDLVPSKGGDIRDESALQPALLIKTIAPNVSRDKIEDFCKEHIGEQDGGFKWLSLSDPNPVKKCARIGWVMLHPSSETATERGDGRDEGDEGEEDGRIPINSGGEVGMGTAEKALEAINGKTIYDEQRGDFTCHVGVHIPPREPRKKALWDLFSAPERIDKDLDLAFRLVNKFDEQFGIAFNGVAKIEERVADIRSTGLLQPPATPVVEKKKKKVREEIDMDVDGAEEGEEEEEDDEEEEEEEGTYDEEVDDEDLLVKKKTLDLMIEYLRRVYNFCFFCVFESDSINELMRKCPGGHLRRPRASLSSAAKAAAKASAAGLPFPGNKRRQSIDEAENGAQVNKSFGRSGGKNDQQLLRAFNWVKTYEDKVMQLLEPENIDVRKLGGRPVEEALDDELKKFVKQEDEAKFRCKVPECSKLFKAENFWKKHVEKRHAEWLEGVKRDLNLVNTYVLDPSHIAPSRSDANSNGHFPINNNHIPAGTPRGFSLGNMPMNFPSMPTQFPPGPGFPPFFAHHQVQAPSVWGPPGADFVGHDDRHAPGPMRRGGGRFNTNNRSGPYDRRPRDARDMRWNGGNTGRLSPPRGTGARMGGPNTGGGKWGDGGAAAVGPREAVQGRSLKSYEDLDAVGGNEGGALNY